MTEQQSISQLKNWVILLLVVTLVLLGWRYHGEESKYEASEERTNRTMEENAMLKIANQINNHRQDSLLAEIDSTRKEQKQIEIRYVTKIRTIHSHSAGYVDSLLSARYDQLYPRFLKATTK